MPEQTRLEKAEFRQLNSEFTTEIEPGKWVKVQFNPESLKVSFANQIQTPQGDNSGPQARQYVGAGTTKLSLQLWFDCAAPLPQGQAAVNDVRLLTEKVAYFITPQQQGDKFVPPAVRFVWGSFQFDGMMDSLEETLDFFSSDGRPLRAAVSLNLSQQKITKYAYGKGAGGGQGALSPGTQPLAQATSGSSLPALTASLGVSASWQAIATANGIENPRLLAPGQLINMNLSTGRS